MARGKQPETSSQKSSREFAKELLNKTLARRWPGMDSAAKLDREELTAILDDWESCAKELGFSRFDAGVKNAWQHCQFFPRPHDIRTYAPPPKITDDEARKAEFADLARRRKAGEKFYSLTDVLLEFAEQITSGKIKPKDPTWGVWARTLKSSAAKKKAVAQKLADRMLAESK